MPDLSYILSYAEPVSAALKKTLQDVEDEFPSDLSAQGKWAMAELKDYACRPSKRLRGSLAAFLYDKLTGKNLAEAGLQLAVVLELMQNYLLIIDDVMDRSPLRRGLPTVQVLYKSAHPDSTTHEANMTAINVGLLAQHIASLVLARIPADLAKVKTATEIIHRNIAITGLGQIDDLYQQLGRSVSVTDIERKHLLKSAYYTFINPLQSALALAGVDDHDIDAIKFGSSAGTAFQVHDDFLGIFGDGDEIGKANLDDIREGKYTFFIQYVADHGESDDIAKLTRIMGDPKASAADLLVVRTIIENTGALEASRILESNEAIKAKKAVDRSDLWSEEVKTSLKALVDYSIERRK